MDNTQISQQTLIPVVGRNEATLDYFCKAGNENLIQQLVAMVQGSPGHPTVFLWGPSGSGKTHLLNACCDLAERHERPFRYLTFGDDSIARLIDSKLEQNLLVCLDNLQRLDQQDESQLHTLFLYEQVVAVGGSLVVAARCPLNQIRVDLADLVSRLSSGGTYQLAMLDDDNKRAALHRRAYHRGFELNGQVLDFIMNRFDRDTVSLFALLDQIDSASLTHQRKITVPFIRSIIQPPGLN